MKLLLDTHILIWWMTDSSYLSTATKQIIRETSDIFVSAASIWEIAIKRSRGDLKMLDEIDIQKDISDESLITELPITWWHALAVGGLPYHHKDPFDRVLVAQAQVEGLTLVTRDAAIQKYDVALLPA